MPDYIYLLANRLSPSQQSALQSIREAAREAGMTVFLTGGAVRDLTSGSPVRDIDVSVQGNALDLKPALEAAGAVLWGEASGSQTLFARFPGSVRVEVSSARREEFPKPGKPVYHPGSILEDLRRRDFTANAMALSLNEGSFGLLMDPLNGVADLEARVLRLVSNYGFLEDPIRLIRAARLQARLGWELEEKTKVRVENAKEEGVISHISPYQAGYELEEILHEEDGLKILKALEADGWMKALFPAWTSAKVDLEAMVALREVLVQLQMQGVNPDPSAAQAQLLTVKLPPKDVAALKKMFVRPGFVHEWETQEERAKEVGKRLTGKEAATPSSAWKLLTSVDPEAVLWLGLTSKSPAVQAKFKDFFSVWPEARQKIPYALMQEMRITPELDGYQDLLRSIFFELIDGKLTTDEEIRQFLEPYSPPAPPPPVTIRRARAKKGAEKHKETREIDDEDEVAEARPGGDDDDGEEEEGGEEESGRGELIARSGSARETVPEPPPLKARPVEVDVEPEKEAATGEVPSAPVESAKKSPAKPPVEAPVVMPHQGEAKDAGAKKAAAKMPAATPAPVVKAVASKAAPVPAVKSVPKPDPWSAAKATSKSASKPGAAKPVAKTIAKPVAKTGARGKAAAKVVVRSKPAAKKAASFPVKKKLATPATKPKSAKVMLKAKPGAGKPGLKAKTASAKSLKSVPSKKKR